MRILALLSCLLSSLAVGEFRAATFEADVTIPLGHACMGGGIEPAKEIITPLLAKGVVLSGGPGGPIVWCAVDWCEIRNDAYDHWRDALAAAAGTTRERVLVSSVHQHDAPVVDYEAQRLLDGVGLEKALCDVAFAKEAVARVADALRASIAQARAVTHYGVGSARVEGIASNRRVKAEDGKVIYHRGSATADPKLREQPEGEIDPLLKLLTFWDGDACVAAISAYATHPMSHYGKGGVNYDFPGMARERMEAETGVAQVHFSGCSGDVTAGKFNDGNPANREVLANKMYGAMKAAFEETDKFPLRTMDVRVAKLKLEPKGGTGFDKAEMERIVSDAGAKTFQRNLAAMGLSWRARVEAGQPIDVVAVDFGKAVYLQMPAESFVGYQLAAQEMTPNKVVITAGYGECAPGYIPTERGTAEGFQNESWCWVAPGSHVPLLNAMREVLGQQQ